MRAVLIDDEQLAIDVLEILLTKIGDVKIVGKYTDPQLALQEIKDLNADVVFLDMEMGGMHGLQFAEKLTEKLPHIDIVFVTAHSQFALEAFEVYAVDYLLKPVNRKRLEKTTDKLRMRQKKYTNRKNEIEEDDNLVARTMGSFHLLDTNNNEVKWRTKKVKELFVYLWHQSPNPVHRSRILDDLWKEHPKDRATTLMHTTLYQLRKLLKEIGFPNPVELINENYIINVKVESDFNEIERMIQSSKVSLPVIENIVALYKGNYLEDEDYHWALSTQQRMKSNFLEYLEKYAIQEMKNEKQLYLIELCLEKLIELEPYNEKFVSLLVDFYGRTKNLIKLVDVVEKFNKMWLEELGIDMPNEIIEIYNKHLIHS